MPETLGSLIDKLTIVKLKQFHSTKKSRLVSLSSQETQLVEDIDKFVSDALTGVIPYEKLIFAANKIFKKKGNETRTLNGGIGDTIAELANVNCELWHKQEKVYDFESVPVEKKNSVVKSLSLLNLERNNCIDRIDSLFSTCVESLMIQK